MEVKFESIRSGAIERIRRDVVRRARGISWVPVDTNSVREMGRDGALSGIRKDRFVGTKLGSVEENKHEDSWTTDGRIDRPTLRTFQKMH